MTATGPRGPDATIGDAADVTAVQTVPPVPTPSSDGDQATEARSRTRKRRKATHRVALEWVILIAIALAIAFLIKTFLFQAFFIPSASMEPSSATTSTT